MLAISIQVLPHGQGLPLPSYATQWSAGMDMYAAIDGHLLLLPGQRRLIPTGIAVALPDGYEMQIRPRSGLALKHGVTVCNSPGTVDSDYRGEVCVILINHGDTAFTITRGDRISQMVIAPVTRCSWNLVTSLDETERGAGGFGSSGTGV